MKQVIIAASAALLLAGCAEDREDYGQNVGIRGREDNSSFVVNQPKGFNNVAVKCLPAGDQVLVIMVAREGAGVSSQVLDVCPPLVAEAQATP